MGYVRAYLAQVGWGVLVVSSVLLVSARAATQSRVSVPAAAAGAPAAQVVLRGANRGTRPLLTSRLQTVVAFGDSLTDTTNQGRLAPRVAARFGISPMEWVVRQAQSVIGPLETARFFNYGRVGATASYSGNWIGDRLLQYGEDVRRGLVPQATLIHYQGGVNDLLARLHLIRAVPSAWSRVVVGIVRDEILRQVIQLRQLHPGVPVVVWTVPDVPSFPIVALRLTAAEVKNVRAHLAIINEAIRQLPQVAPEFVVVDGEFEVRAAHGAIWAFDGVPVYGSPFHSRFDALFGDALHPSAVFNAYLGNRLIAVLNRRLRMRVPMVPDRTLGALARALPW